MELSVKRGDTFRLFVEVRDAEGGAVDLTEIGIASQLRLTELIHQFQIVRFDDTGGRFEMLATAAETTDWQPDTSPRFDIRFMQGDTVFSSATRTVAVEQDITRD